MSTYIYTINRINGFFSEASVSKNRKFILRRKFPVVKTILVVKKNFCIKSSVKSNLGL